MNEARHEEYDALYGIQIKKKRSGKIDEINEALLRFSKS